MESSSGGVGSDRGRSLTDLPDLALLHIFDRLPLPDLLRIDQVCGKFRELKLSACHRRNRLTILTGDDDAAEYAKSTQFPFVVPETRFDRRRFQFSAITVRRLDDTAVRGLRRHFPTIHHLELALYPITECETNQITGLLNDWAAALSSLAVRFGLTERDEDEDEVDDDQEDDDNLQDGDLLRSSPQSINESQTYLLRDGLMEEDQPDRATPIMLRWFDVIARMRRLTRLTFVSSNTFEHDVPMFNFTNLGHLRTFHFSSHHSAWAVVRWMAKSACETGGRLRDIQLKNRIDRCEIEHFLELDDQLARRFTQLHSPALEYASLRRFCAKFQNLRAFIFTFRCYTRLTIEQAIACLATLPHLTHLELHMDAMSNHAIIAAPQLRTVTSLILEVRTTAKNHHILERNSLSSVLPNLELFQFRSYMDSCLTCNLDFYPINNSIANRRRASSSRRSRPQTLLPQQSQPSPSPSPSSSSSSPLPPSWHATFDFDFEFDFNQLDDVCGRRYRECVRQIMRPIPALFPRVRHSAFYQMQQRRCFAFSHVDDDDPSASSTTTSTAPRCSSMII